MSSEQDVNEKLAAAGFAPLVGLTMWHRCDDGWSVGQYTGTAAMWNVAGKCTTESAPDLVPLPSPQQEPERLSDDVLEDYASLGECHAKSMASECIASRREIAELREQNKHLGELVRELLSLLDAYMRARLDSRTDRDMCGVNIGDQRQYQAWLRLERAWFQLRGDS